MIFDDAGSVFQIAWLELYCHECFKRRVEFTSNVEFTGRHKAESWVVGLMPKNDYRSNIELSNPLKALANQSGTNASMLVIRGNSHRPETHDFLIRVFNDRYR